MVDKQTQKSTPPRILFAVLALLFSVFFSGLINTTLANQSVNAINGCPGQEMPGTGANQGKCVGPDGNPTANVPEGAQTPETPGGTISNADTTDNTDEVTCAIEKIGWILCPVIEQSGRIGDQAFAFLAKTFLETEPELISSTEGVGTRVAWDMARNLANIMFIIAFLVIIYSQVTGAGITNYGIKKMLPKLIFAAVAVNVSYYICQIMVDLTNIMGYEIQQFLTDAAKAVTQNTAMPIATGDSFQSGGGTLSTIALFVLATGAIVYFLLPLLGAVIGLVLITCLSIIVILLLRKAFIVLLIVASPIAFVMYLLPNTEKYFQKWLSMFWKLLLVFPVIGMLMGGGQLASSIILAAGVSSNSYNDAGTKCVTLPKHASDGSSTEPQGSTSSAAGGECSPGAVPFLLGLTAAGIAVLPLIAVYSVLQGALSAAGAIGGKIGGTIGNWNNGRKGSLSKQRQELGDARRDKRALAAMENKGSFSNIASLGSVRRRAFRNAKRSSVKGQLGRATEDAVFDKAYDSKTGELTEYGQQMAGAGLLRGASEDAQKRVVRSLQGIEQKNENEESSALQYQYRNASSNDIEKKLDDAVKAGDAVMIRAFTEALSKRGSDGANRIAEVVAYNHGSKELQNVINNYTDIKSKRADVDAWASKGGTLQSHQTSKVYGALSDSQLATQTGESFKLAKGTGVVDETVQFVTADGSVKSVQRGAAMAASVKEMSGENKTTAAGPPPPRP